MRYFSVLMSVYIKESPKFLEESIESIMNNTIIPKEIILVLDGGLTNELYKVVDSLCHKHKTIKVVALEKNMGLGRALSIGLSNCTCDIIARMDSDDVCKKDRFEKQLNILTNNKDIDIVGSWIAEFIIDTSKIISIKKVPKTHKKIVEYSKYRCPMNHPTVMFRKKAVEQSGGYSDLILFEDYHLWIRMILSGAIFYNIQEPLLFFRVSENTFNRRGGIKYLTTEIKFNILLFKKKHINILQLLFNVTLRVFVRLIPNRARMFFYNIFLRKNITK